MTFPLFRLPLLASIKVIKNTDVKYLIYLIQLSTRAKNLVKLSKVHIELTVLKYSIQFQKLDGEEMVRELQFSSLSEKPADIPFKPPRQSKFDTKFQYQIQAYKKMMNDFVEVFKVCSVSFKLETAYSYISLCFMEHAKSLGLKFATARVLIAGSHGKIYQWLLEVCSNASQLLVLFDTEETFTFKGFNEYRMHKIRLVPKDLRFKWLTVDHMRSLINCSEVSVDGMIWESMDFNRLIKFWMASDGNLKFWKLRGCRDLIIPRVVMDGINKRELGYHRFEIQRADGVKAGAFLLELLPNSYRRLNFVVLQFTLVIWHSVSLLVLLYNFS